MNATKSQVAETAIPTDAEYVRVKQLSRRFSLSKSMIHGLIDQGELKAVKIGNAVLIPIASVREFESRFKFD